jgi:hypothetical protein
MPPTVALCSKMWIFEKAFSARRYLRKSASAYDSLIYSAYFAAVNPDGPAPMIATESTLSRVLLGMEPMFLVEIYPLRCTEPPPLASRKSLLYGRDIESIDVSASGMDRVTLMEQSHHLLRKSPNDLTCCCLTSCSVWGVHLLDALLTGLTSLTLSNGKQGMRVFSRNARTAKCNGQA